MFYRFIGKYRAVLQRTGLAGAMTSNDVRQWRIATLSSLVPSGKPIRMVHGNTELVLFREADGRCRALVDRCAHRRAALSGGRLTDQFVIECPYHGWRYNGATGACVAIPNLRADEKIPKNYRVQSFETLERDGFIQILMGTGDTGAEPNDVAVPNLDRQWEGERYLAYPEVLFMDTLADSPSAILEISGVQIHDDHPIGDPVVTGDQISIEYAADRICNSSLHSEQVVEDFPYTVRISATKSAARITVIDNDTAAVRATALIVAVPTGVRLTRALWRGAEATSSATSLTIECREHVDPAPLRATTNVVSRIWARTPPPAAAEQS